MSVAWAYQLAYAKFVQAPACTCTSRLSGNAPHAYASRSHSFEVRWNQQYRRASERSPSIVNGNQQGECRQKRTWEWPEEGPWDHSRVRIRKHSQERLLERQRPLEYQPRGPPRCASAYEISKSTGFHLDSDFRMDFWISKVDFWISFEPLLFWTYS